MKSTKKSFLLIIALIFLCSATVIPSANAQYVPPPTAFGYFPLFPPIPFTPFIPYAPTALPFSYGPTPFRTAALLTTASTPGIPGVSSSTLLLASLGLLPTTTTVAPIVPTLYSSLGLLPTYYPTVAPTVTTIPTYYPTVAPTVTTTPTIGLTTALLLGGGISTTTLLLATGALTTTPTTTSTIGTTTALLLGGVSSTTLLALGI